MNHWLILLLTIVAMWAIVLVFMWWRTTEKWDWASAELKPPRTVRLSLETAAEFAEVLQILELKQRVTALEKDNRWHRTAAELLMNLEPRLAEAENVMNQIHKLEPPLPLAATPSRPTASPTTGSPSGAAERDYTPRLSPASWRSGLATTTGGPAEHLSQSVDPPDAS